jgi:hypothetical protein
MVIKGEIFVEVNAQQLVGSFVQGRVVVVMVFNSKDTIGIEVVWFTVVIRQH